ncbi:putative zinc-binding metallopeptidase [Porphyromonas macacae]|uniref:putative zinc-binding metallopeptidase n=1 Tax=Porphyromonas macacae TaxID=28115 RepID=UPI0024ACAA8F|nr:putative zinc-binding metallopeptidase [Porphyromonas macacae]
MKSIYQKICLTAILAGGLILSSCQKQHLASDSVIDKYFPQESTTELDRWAIDLFKPYNIQTLYRWQKEHLPSGSFGIPPKIEQVKPVLEAFKMLLLDLYTLEKAGGKDFFKDKGLIRITLLGGFEMHENNVLMKLWYPKTASNEMFAFDVNAFDPSDKKNVYRLMRSLHHQFARRLIEHIPYNRDAFLLINPKAYGVLPLAPSPADVYRRVGLSPYAHRRGFYTLYSMASPEDEFAEIISTLLLHTAVELKEAEDTAARPVYPDQPESVQEAKEAYRALREKRAFVERYFRQDVGISLSRLQLLSLKQLNAYYKLHKTK